MSSAVVVAMAWLVLLDCGSAIEESTIIGLDDKDQDGAYQEQSGQIPMRSNVHKACTSAEQVFSTHTRPSHSRRMQKINGRVEAEAAQIPLSPLEDGRPEVDDTPGTVSRLENTRVLLVRFITHLRTYQLVSRLG